MISEVVTPNPPPLLDAALRLLAREWSIVPTGKDKIPCVLWKELQNRRLTEQEVRRIDAEKHPAIWGIVTGALSNLVIVDFDGEAGGQWLEHWGLSPHVQTGSGGFHVYVRHPGHHVPTLNAKSAKNMWKWPGVDVRGDGGYAAAIGRNEKGSYRVLRELAPYAFDALPEDLRLFLKGWQDRKAAPEAGTDVPTSPTAQPETRSSPQRVGSEVLVRRALDMAPASGRNNSGFWLATQLRDNGYSQAETMSACSDFRGRAPATNIKGEREVYGADEVRASVREAFRQPARQAWTQREPSRGKPPSAPGSPLMASVDSSPTREEELNGEPLPEISVDECVAEAYQRLALARSDFGNLPEISVSNRQLRDITSDSLSALRDANDPPTLFVRGGQMVQVVQDERGRHIVCEASESAVRGRIGRAANYIRWIKGKKDEFERIEVAPPMDVVKDILALPPLEWGLPSLLGVTESPVLRPDGTILSKEGYDAATSLVYAPPAGFRLPTIPESPSTADTAGALTLLREAIGEFPFVDTASETNAIATLLTVPCRAAINGPTPLALFDATSQGTGKTLLSEVVSICATGRTGALFSAPRDDEEWRKQLTSVLREGASVVVIDNVSRRLDSGELCKVLTEITHGDRILGKSETVSLPVQCCWVATGNNLQLGGDMPRRCYWVRMDAQCSKPFNRTGFKHANLKEWVLEHRAELLGALLTLARAWYAAGKPAPSMVPLGSFESWTVIVGGILQHAGVEGFLGNSDELYAQADVESVQWEAFLLTLGEAFYGEPFLAAKVVEKLNEKTWNQESKQTEPTEKACRLRETLPDSILEAVDRPGSLQRRLGNAFSDRIGRRFGESGVYLKKSGTVNRATEWITVLPKAGTNVTKSARTDAPRSAK